MLIGSRTLRYFFAKTALDLGRFRNPEQLQLVRQSLKKRFRDPGLADQIVQQDQKWRQVNYQYEKFRFNLNKLTKSLKQSIKDQTDPAIIAQEKERISLEIKAQKHKQTEIVEALKLAEQILHAKVNSVGNIIENEVPVSKDQEDNKVISVGKVPVSPKSKSQEYGDLFVKLDGVDCKRGQKIAGHRGYFLKKDGFQLARALTNYAIDFLESQGYSMHQPPVMIKQDLMKACCQLSTLDQDVYKLQGEGMALIATSQQPLASMYTDEVLEELPIKLGGYSMCFRKEAGAHGKDNQGIFRVHHFEKVEQFVICKEEQSRQFLDSMIKTSMKFYDSLAIPYRVVSIVSGELNDAAAIKYDLEAWFPGSKRYRELVSVSNCTDYQSRMLEIKYRQKNATKYVHMLNGTLCAVERTLCCLVENWQTQQGIQIPASLSKYVGKDFIRFSR